MATRRYLLKSGKRVAGVTTIISRNLGWNKQALMYWTWNEGMEGRDYRETRRGHADAGTIAHYLMDCKIKKRTPNIPERYPNVNPKVVAKAKTGYMNFLVWMNSFKVKFLFSEVPVISKKYKYGGTLDCIALVKNSLCLMDWKTGKEIYPDMLIQLAAYGKAWEEEHPQKKLSGGFYLFEVERETAAFHLHHWTDLEDAWQAFLLLLRLDKLKKKMKG